MSSPKKIICFFKGIWRSLQIGYPFNFPMSGHDYVEQENGDLVCELCRHIIK